MSRNPLKSGQCFLQKYQSFGKDFKRERRRNPLKSGQCFLLLCVFQGKRKTKLCLPCRNPLKSGQCFLHSYCALWIKVKKESQSPQIGSMFPTLLEKSLKEKGLI